MHHAGNLGLKMGLKCYHDYDSMIMFNLLFKNITNKVNIKVIAEYAKINGNRAACLCPHSSQKQAIWHMKYYMYKKSNH